METKSRQFKTNINCGGCIAAIKPHLDNNANITHWRVDTDNPEKILTVESSTLSDQDIIATIEQAGFKATPIN